MHWGTSRRRGSSILAVIGSCLAVYIVLAVGYHSLIEPNVGKNYTPTPEGRSVGVVPVLSPVAVEPSASAAFAAATPDATEKAAAVAQKSTSKKHASRSQQDRLRNPWDFAWGNGSRRWF